MMQSDDDLAKLPEHSPHEMRTPEQRERDRQENAELHRRMRNPTPEEVAQDKVEDDAFWRDHCVGTYTPPAPYRVFRIIQGGAKPSKTSPAAVADGDSSLTDPKPPSP